MTSYFGDFAEDDTVNIPFNTFTSDDPSASSTITDLANSDIHVHKDGGLTQTSAGATVVINFDGITGNHLITIDTSADAFYVTGSEYQVRIEGTTVDVGTINAWVGCFSIERAGGALAVAKTIKTETALIVGDTNELQLDDIPGAITALNDAPAVSAAVIADAVWDELITGAAHNTATSAGKRLRQTSELGTYSNGQIFIDTNASNTNTTDFEDGTEVNPVSTIAAANTLAASLGISAFHIASGSSITLAATQANQVFTGQNWILVLGTQSIDGSTFIGADVSGVGTNSTGHQHFIDCDLGATTIPGDTHIINSGLAGTITLGEAGDYFLVHCHGEVAGTGTTTIDFGAALNASNLSVRAHSGGLEIANMGAGTGTYNATFEGFGQIIWAASCSATSNASIRGHWKITDNASGAVTETHADPQANITLILADTNELQGDNLPGLIATLDAVVDTVKVDTAAILIDTADIQPNYATATNLATVDTVVDGIQTDLSNGTDGLGALATLINGLDDVTTAEVLTQVNAALDTAISELGVAAPTATPTMRTGLMLMYMALRNLRDTTASADIITNNAGTTICSATVSDDAVTFRKTEYS